MSEEYRWCELVVGKLYMVSIGRTVWLCSELPIEVDDFANPDVIPLHEPEGFCILKIGRTPKQVKASECYLEVITTNGLHRYVICGPWSDFSFHPAMY